MNDFLKVSLRGLIVTLLLPFIVALLAIYTVYCVLFYIVLLFKNLVIFFAGGSIDKFKEDAQAKKILDNQVLMQQNTAQAVSNLMHTAIQQNPVAVKAMAEQEISTQQIHETPVEQDIASQPLETPQEEVPTVDVQQNDDENCTEVNTND